jgi:hypothetical protein
MTEQALPVTKWTEKSKERASEFAALLKAPAYKGIFDEKYFDGLEKRKAYLAGPLS